MTEKRHFYCFYYFFIFPIVALTPLMSMEVWCPHCFITSYINLTVFYIYDMLTDGGNLVKS